MHRHDQQGPALAAGTQQRLPGLPQHETVEFAVENAGMGLLLARCFPDRQDDAGAVGRNQLLADIGHRPVGDAQFALQCLEMLPFDILFLLLRGIDRLRQAIRRRQGFDGCLGIQFKHEGAAGHQPLFDAGNAAQLIVDLAGDLFGAFCRPLLVAAAEQNHDLFFVNHKKGIGRAGMFLDDGLGQQQDLALDRRPALAEGLADLREAQHLDIAGDQRFRHQLVGAHEVQQAVAEGGRVGRVELLLGIGVVEALLPGALVARDLRNRLVEFRFWHSDVCL